jgi:opacity protein-like surface antigen
VHGLVGAVHTSASGFGFSHSDTSFGSALGGGLDYHLLKRISLGLQTDDMRTTFLNHAQNELRLSVGLVFDF